MKAIYFYWLGFLSSVVFAAAPVPPTITISGSDMTVVGNDATANGYRLHYNFSGVYNDSIPLNSTTSTAIVTPDGGHVLLSSEPLVLNIEPGTQVTATAYNADGESAYGNIAFMPGSSQVLPRALSRSAPRFSSTNHATIVNMALGSEGLDPLQLAAIVAYDVGVDFTNLDDASYHFDDNQLPQSAERIRTMLQSIDTLPDAQVAPTFGTVCHILQDFYAHTDFTEQWLAKNPGITLTAQLSDATVGSTLPDFNQTDAAYYGQWVSGYWGGGFFENSLEGRHPTYAVPASHTAPLLIYHDLETGEARPGGYTVGFVPWHGHVNKDGTDASKSPEGASTLAGRSNNLNEFAMALAAIHTHRVFNGLSEHAKQVLRTARVAPSFLEVLNTAIANPGAVVSLIPGFETLIQGSTFSAVNLNLSNILPKGNGYTAAVSGTLVMFGDEFGTLNAPVSGKLTFNNGRIKVKLNGLAPFSPFDRLSTFRMSKITISGLGDAAGSLVGSANIRIKGDKLAKALSLTIPWQSKLLP